MSYSKAFSLAAIGAALLFGASRPAASQIVVGIGVAPVCPYGYYDYAPYDCSPYGYYGPDWFSGGYFIGAGPWFHGPHGFSGHVDNRYDPRQGYAGPTPARGAHAFSHFQPNESRNGQGQAAPSSHNAGQERSAGVQRGGGGGGNRGGGGSHGGGGHPR